MSEPIDVAIPSGTDPGDFLVFTHIDMNTHAATHYRIRLPVDLAAESRGRSAGYAEAVAKLRQFGTANGPIFTPAQLADYLEASTPTTEEPHA